MRIPIRTTAMCASSAAAALVMTASPALADPVDPSPPPPAYSVLNPPGVETQQAPPEGVSHLSSPENLPPGTTNAPVEPPRSRGMSYLRDLWHAVQTQDVSTDDALLLLTQRPLDPDAVPPPGMSAGPQAGPAEPLAPTP